MLWTKRHRQNTILETIYLDKKSSCFQIRLLRGSFRSRALSKNFRYRSVDEKVKREHQVTWRRQYHLVT